MNGFKGNNSLVLETLEESGGLSPVEIQRRCNLSRTTTRTILANLERFREIEHVTIGKSKYRIAR